VNSRSPRPILPLWAALIVAAGAGIVLDGGFPDLGVWPLTFVGIALILVTLVGRRLGTAFLVGFVASLAFYLVHVSWTALYLGPVPWVALSTLESLFFAAGAMLLTLAYRWVPRVWPRRLGRYLLLPLVVAGLWTLREEIVSTWPYGGFAWGRVALSQSESPLAGVVAWTGVSGLSFLMVLLVAVIVEIVRTPRENTIGWDARGRRPAFTGSATAGVSARVGYVPRVTAAVAAITVLFAIPLWPVEQTGTTTVAAVQGNGKAGYFDGAAPGDVLAAQASATLALIDKNVQPDMVVWPENGSDLNPLENKQAADVLDYLGNALQAPLVVGTITENEGKYYNSSLLWEPGYGSTDQYDKKHPVPFGEYVPDRAFWEPFAPDLIGLIQREYTPGTRDNVFDIGGVMAGLSICFDIADDALTRDAVRDGAEVILAQTNNADFGRTDENQQQLAIARLRSIETARSLVNISTVGTSQMIGPRGETLSEIPAYEPGSMVATLPLVSTITPAMAFGAQLAWFVSLGGLLGLIVAGISQRPSRRRG
jgi:apolipoprotein N-acyltransferase